MTIQKSSQLRFLVNLIRPKIRRTQVRNAMPVKTHIVIWMERPLSLSPPGGAETAICGGICRERGYMEQEKQWAAGSKPLIELKVNIAERVDHEVCHTPQSGILQGLLWLV